MNPSLHLPSNPLEEDSSKPQPPGGLTALALVVNTAPCRSAMMNARALLAGRCSRLTLVHCITGDHSLTSMQAFLSSLAQELATNCTLQIDTDIIIKKFAHQPVAEVLAEHVESTQPGLVLVSSSSISASAPRTRRNSYTGAPSTPQAPSLNRQTCNQPLSLRISQEISSVPVLLVKADPRSTFLPRLAASRPITCMMELQATSRDMMDWATAFLDPSRDKLLLAVANAFEREGQLKATAARTLTAFNVQATTGTSASTFKVAQRPLKGDAVACLPQALTADNVNLLMIHAPRSRYLSHCVVDLVQTSAASVLIWPAGEPASASLPRTATVSTPGYSFRPATPLVRPRSISCETGQTMESTLDSTMDPASTSSSTTSTRPSTPTCTSPSFPSPSSATTTTTTASLLGRGSTATERTSPSAPSAAQTSSSGCSPAPERRVHSTKLPSIPRPPPARVPSQSQLHLKRPSRTSSQALPIAKPSALTHIQLEDKKPRAFSAR